MPGIEIKGRSKIANYRHGGRAGHAIGSVVGRIIARKLRKPKPHKDKPPSKTHKDVPTMAAEGGRIGFKRAGAVTKADLAKRDLWRKRELKRRSQIGQRKSKWDIKGGISGHPLNPFRVHAEGKAIDWTSKRKDVYGRTRDDLKKSRDPNVKSVAEGFQQMDYKDKARSDPRYIKGSKFYEERQPKLTKRVHVGRKTGGRIDLKKPHKDKPPSKTHKDVPTMAAEGGRIGLKKGGSDKKWIQKAVNPKHKGYCTPMTKKTCTPARKALARTFKKKAKTGWG